MVGTDKVDPGDSAGNAEIHRPPGVVFSARRGTACRLSAAVAVVGQRGGVIPSVGVDVDAALIRSTAPSRVVGHRHHTVHCHYQPHNNPQF